MSEEGERTNWHGFGQPRPKLPAYLRPSKRPKSLDEFERPERHDGGLFDDDEVTLRGVAREAARFLVIFFIAGVIIVSAWRWEYGNMKCVEVVHGFKVGWC